MLPGLSGPFILDDFPNLSIFAHLDGLTNTQILQRFVFSEHIFPGRWLSFVSFFINDNAWPSDPESYKNTNILIHSFNAILVFVFTRQLLLLSGCRLRKSVWLALGVMTFWAFNPFLQSTYYSVIQRMTLLMSMFTLIGLIVFVLGRTNTEWSAKKRYTFITVGLFLFGFLALSSKENGVLIFAYALVLEIYLKQIGDYQLKCWEKVKYIFLFIPVALILMAVLYFSVNADFSYRNFSQYERLISQPYILFSYVNNFILPSLNGLGLFHDDMQAFKSIKLPEVYIPLIILISVGLYSIRNRAKYPILFLMFWFFLCGHLLESTALSLELYFEHRNYLPIAIVPIGIALMLVKERKYNWMVGFFSIVMTGFVVTNQFLTTPIWGDRDKLYSFWYIDHPNSERAVQEVANSFQMRGNAEQAQSLLESFRKNHSMGHATLLNIVSLKCKKRALTDDEYNELLKGARSENFTWLALKFIENSYLKNGQFGCKWLNSQQYQELTSAYLNNSHYKFDKFIEKMLVIKAVINFKEGYADYAIELLEHAYKVNNDIKHLYDAAIVAISSNKLNLAENLVEKIEKLEINVRFNLKYKGDITLKDLKHAISEKEIKNDPDDGTTNSSIRHES